MSGKKKSLLLITALLTLGYMKTNQVLLLAALYDCTTRGGFNLMNLLASILSLHLS